MNTRTPPRFARCATSASTSVCGSAQAWPQVIPSPGRITLARSTIEGIMADAKLLDVILRQARTHSDFESRRVPEALLREAHDIMKWGPTTANSQPARIVYLFSKE